MDNVKLNKANLFWGYMLYIQKKGNEIARAGGNPNKVIKLRTYLMEELNYTEAEAKQIEQAIRRDSISEKRKDKNSK
jgi:hypothetical protein